nr:hypothetical protein [Bradyrhizobium sp. CSA112]
MTENVKLPRKLSEERELPPPRRPSHADVIENLDRWANSPGLQPPKSSEEASRYARRHAKAAERWKSE